MASSSNTDSLTIAFHCEQCVTDCPDAGASLCPDCYGPLQLWVRTGPSAGTRLDAFCAEELGQSRIERPLALLADVAQKGERSSLHSTACAALAATALDCARRWLGSGELDLAYRLSKGVSGILPGAPEALDLAKKTCDSLVFELLSQARTSHERGHWKKLTSLCNQILEFVADNAEALELLGKAKELHADNLVDSAQQHLDTREYDAAIRLAREALELVPENLAAQELIRTTLDARVADILGHAEECCSRKDWVNASTLCNEALKIHPGNVAASELLKRVHELYAKSVVDRAQECLGRGECEEALALCNTLESHYSTKFERCGQIRHDVYIALVGRSEAAMSADDWQNALTFAQRAMEVEPSNPDAERLRADAEGKLHLKDLAAHALAAYKARDLTACGAACDAFLSYQKGCGAHVEFTDASGSVIDFVALPGRLGQDIAAQREAARRWHAEQTRIRRATIVRRFLKMAAACTVVALLILGIGHWRKVRFDKSIRTFDTAMQAGSYDAAKAIAPKIAGKHTPAADLLAYFRSRAAFETALNGANAGILTQYGATKWADLQAQKQAAEASAGVPAKGVEAYQRATSLLAECQAMAEAGEKARKDREAREKALAEANSREERAQTERRRDQNDKETADARLKARVESDLETVIGSIRSASSGTRRLDARVVSAPEDLRAAANRGWPDAQVLCGLCSMFGLGGFEKDRDEAVGLFRKAANQGHAYAQFQLGLAYGGDRDEENAAKWFRKAADQGLAEAQFMMGVMYAEGVGITKNEATAVEWWLKAAEQNHTQAQNNLGQFYAFGGVGVPRDREEAVRWLRKAASAGIADATRTLAEMQGGTPRSSESKTAAEEAVEQNNTGWRYLTGDGVRKDPYEAAKWLLKAARNGSPNAQCTLGVMYHDGVGVDQDDRQAAAWYRKSADQGFSQAQLNLGIMYNNGWGVARNVTEAVRWFRLAARQGDETAIANLRALNVEW